MGCLACSLFLIYQAAAPKTYLSLPAPLPEFVGRKRTIQEIQKVLTKTHRWDIPIAVLWGEGGIGKTEAAIHFAHAHAKEYSLIYWINAGSKEIYEKSIFSLAKHLGLFFNTDTSFEQILSRVHQVLNLHPYSKPWLLIYDNADEKITFPESGNGKIIVTSRNKEAWDPEQCIELFPFSKNAIFNLCEAIDLGISNSDSDQLAEDLGCHPLALNQAIHYLKESPHLSLKEYLETLEKHKAAIYEKSSPAVRYQHDLLLTWNLTFSELAKDCPLASEWLQICGHLHPDRIPFSWLEFWLQSEKQICCDLVKLQANEILKELVNRGLIRINCENQTLSLHRLKQNLLNANQEANDKGARAALQLLTSYAQEYIYYDHLEWDCHTIDKLSDWRPNATWWLSRNASTTDSNTLIVQLLNILGNFNVVFRGQFVEANKLFNRALSLLEAENTPTREQIYTYLNQAFCLHLCGKDDQAKAIVDFGLTLTDTHTNALVTCHGLSTKGAIHFWTDDNHVAIKCCEQALKILSSFSVTERLAERCEILKCLAGAWSKLGEHEKSLDYSTQALKLNSEVFQEKANAQRAFILNNMGKNYHRMGQYDRALDCHFASFNLTKNIPNYPTVLPFLNLTAISHNYRCKKNYRKSFYFIRKIMKIEKTLSLANWTPRSGLIAWNLAELYLETGKPKKAIPLLEDTITKNLQLGNSERHRLSKSCYFSLGKAYIQISKAEKGIPYLEKFLEILQDEPTKNQSELSSVLGILKIEYAKDKPQKSQFYQKWLEEVEKATTL